jgi:8-oxo-dGTP diphosphatase
VRSSLGVEKVAGDNSSVVRVVTAQIEVDGRYLIVQRPDKAVFPGLWEFPGGRVRDHETDEEALQRTLMRRIGCVAQIGEKLLEKDHAYSDYSVCLVLYRVKVRFEDASPKSVKAMAWVEPVDFENYEFPPADEESARRLLEG